MLISGQDQGDADQSSQEKHANIKVQSIHRPNVEGMSGSGKWAKRYQKVPGTFWFKFASLTLTCRQVNDGTF